MARQSYDVAVVGGGINGCVAAKYLAEDHDVVVLEKGRIAGNATGKASGLISIVHDYIDHPGAARYAIDFFESYDGTGEFEYTRRSSVKLVSEEMVASAREEAERMAENFDVDYLDSPEAVEERFPGVFNLDPIVGAVDIKEGGFVDPYTLTMTLKEDAEDAGAEVRTGVEVSGVATAGGAVRGVETGAGTIEADHVVVAAGWRTRELVSEFVEVPTRPFRYQTVNLEVERDLPEYFPVAWERWGRLYWRPEHNGDLHVGGGTYFVDEPGETRSTTTEDFRDLVAEVIPHRLRDVGDARIASGDTCPTGDAATPDELAIYDAPPECPDGLVIATGMHGFGIMAAPVTGAAVRSLVTGEDAPFSMAEFALDRFEDRSPDFGSEYIIEPDETLPP